MRAAVLQSAYVYMCVGVCVYIRREAAVVRHPGLVGAHAPCGHMDIDGCCYSQHDYYDMATVDAITWKTPRRAATRRWACGGQDGGGGRDMA